MSRSGGAENKTTVGEPPTVVEGGTRDGAP
jgi:hypothetical protein